MKIHNSGCANNQLIPERIMLVPDNIGNHILKFRRSFRLPGTTVYEKKNNILLFLSKKTLRTDKKLFSS